MKPIVTLFTILSFQVASIMEKTVFLLCILVGSVSCEIPIDCQPDSEEYEIRCLSKKSCREVPVKRVSCESPRICLIPVTSETSLSRGCGQDLNPPSLVTIVKERNDPNEENSDVKRISFFTSIEERSSGEEFNHSRPQGVHQIIPTTVLRL